jgi:DMSO/TMAO reductase YedYZ molybdopterin-dependent catalytic subunit
MATDSDKTERGPAALAGVLAGGAALAAGEFIAAFAAPSPGPVIAVANRVVDDAPGWLVELGKSLFGQSNKQALIIGTIVIALAIAARVGIVGLRRRSAAALSLAAFAVLGFVAIGSDPQGSWGAAFIASLAAGGAGILVLGLSLDRVGATTSGDRRRSGAVTGLTPRPPAGSVTASPTDPPFSRRGFLGWAGAVGATTAVTAAGARQLRSRSSAALARDQVTFASPAANGAEIEATVAAAEMGPVGSTPGISPLIIPNDDFYLIDTALIRPQIDPADWSMTIKGMVDNELTFTYDDLLERADTVAPVTLSCVSNEVGGTLVGNAVWRGVPLVELLDEAGVQDGATQIASRSVDGWFCGFPTEVAYDGRTALVAVGMNDEPLPIKHGFPARLVVSGLYGYVSATKWLSEIELTTWEGFDGYWMDKGWSKLGPVKTQSRIDTPRRGQRLTAGETVAIAGVAWAPDLGIEKVEVQIDDGEWQEATLGESLGADSWVQWRLPWVAVEGNHFLQVRATDNSGETQTVVRSRPDPDGATGWHQVPVNVDRA